MQLNNKRSCDKSKTAAVLFLMVSLAWAGWVTTSLVLQTNDNTVRIEKLSTTVAQSSTLINKTNSGLDLLVNGISIYAILENDRMNCAGNGQTVSTGFSFVDFNTSSISLASINNLNITRGSNHYYAQWNWSTEYADQLNFEFYKFIDNQVCSNHPFSARDIYLRNDSRVVCGVHLMLHWSYELPPGCPWNNDTQLYDCPTYSKIWCTPILPSCKQINYFDYPFFPEIITNFKYSFSSKNIIHISYLDCA